MTNTCDQLHQYFYVDELDISHTIMLFQQNLKYTDCIPQQRGKIPSHKKGCLGYDTKLHLMIKFHF